jgi:hypothetical protein
MDVEESHTLMQAHSIPEPAGRYMAVPIGNAVAASGAGQRAASAAALGAAAAPPPAKGTHA